MIRMSKIERIVISLVGRNKTSLLVHGSLTGHTRTLCIHLRCLLDPSAYAVPAQTAGAEGPAMTEQPEKQVPWSLAIDLAVILVSSVIIGIGSLATNSPSITQRESPMRFVGWRLLPFSSHANNAQRVSVALASAFACSSAVSRSSVSGLSRRPGMNKSTGWADRRGIAPRNYHRRGWPRV